MPPPVGAGFFFEDAPVCETKGTEWLFAVTVENFLMMFVEVVED